MSIQYTDLPSEFRKRTLEKKADRLLVKNEFGLRKETFIPKELRTEEIINRLFDEFISLGAREGVNSSKDGRVRVFLEARRGENIVALGRWCIMAVPKF